MKIVYEARVTSNLLLMDGSKPKGDPRYRSCIEWSEGEYSTKSLYVGGQLPLGQAMWVIIQDTDPQIEIDALPDDANFQNVAYGGPVQNPTK